MNVQQLLEHAYYKTNTSASSYPSWVVLNYLNKAYKNIYRAIVQADEKFFWNWWTTSITIGSTEYDIIRVATEDDEWNIIPWINKVIRVSIQDWETWEIDWSVYPVWKELKELSDNEIRAGEKGWYLADNHIILNWIPTEEWMLKLEWIQSIDDLTLESKEEDIFPWHLDLLDFVWTCLDLGLEYELWRWKQDFDKANFCQQEYQNSLNEMIKHITDRSQAVYYTNLQY